MNIKISENIKKMRKQRDITQEELSSFLGVSYQAISKWERGEGFPDITFIPAIANFFKVSIDELFGMEQIRSQEYLTSIFRLQHEHVDEGRYAEAIKVLRDAIKTFPNNYSLLSDLAIVLFIENTELNEGKESLKEAISLCEHVLGNSTNEKVRSTTRTILCFMYKRLNRDEDAKDLAKTLPHFWESRELVLPEMHEKQDYRENLKNSIDKILSVVCEKIKATEQSPYSDPDIKQLLSIGISGCSEAKYDLKGIENFINSTR